MKGTATMKYIVPSPDELFKNEPNPFKRAALKIAFRIATGGIIF